MGGLGVIIGFSAGVVILLVLAPEELPGPYYYASLIAVLGAGMVGLMDDMFLLRRRMKAILPFLAAVPLGAVVFASGDTMLLGLNLGILTVLAIPLGITSAANASNMVEGFNGLGAGLAIIMSLALVALAFLSGDAQGMYLIFPLLGALLAFLYFNKFPARVFPGDSMTLFAGATLGAAAIIAHQKTLGAILFLPMIVEFLLKLRGRFHSENYGQPDEHGQLHYEGRIESLSHLLMTCRPMKEWQIVLVFWTIEAALSGLVILAAVMG